MDYDKLSRALTQQQICSKTLLRIDENGRLTTPKSLYTCLDYRDDIFDSGVGAASAVKSIVKSLLTGWKPRFIV